MKRYVAVVFALAVAGFASRPAQAADCAAFAQHVSAARAAYTTLSETNHSDDERQAARETAERESTAASGSGSFSTCRLPDEAAFDALQFHAWTDELKSRDQGPNLFVSRLRQMGDTLLQPPPDGSGRNLANMKADYAQAQALFRQGISAALAARNPGCPPDAAPLTLLAIAPNAPPIVQQKGITGEVYVNVTI